jgi:replicative DNA helicase
MEDDAMAAYQVTTQVLDHSPPADVDAELGVLGSILLMPDTCDEVSLVLRAEDFYDDANQRLFRQMQEMHDAGRKIDVTLLVDRLKASGEFETIGGLRICTRSASRYPTRLMPATTPGSSGKKRLFAR